MEQKTRSRPMYLDHRSDRVANLVGSVLAVVAPIHHGHGVRMHRLVLMVVMVMRFGTFGGRCRRVLGGDGAHGRTDAGAVGRWRRRGDAGRRMMWLNQNRLGRLRLGRSSGGGRTIGGSWLGWCVAKEALSHLMQVGTTLHAVLLRLGW